MNDVDMVGLFAKSEADPKKVISQPSVVVVVPTKQIADRLKVESRDIPHVVIDTPSHLLRRIFIFSRTRRSVSAVSSIKQKCKMLYGLARNVALISIVTNRRI